MPFWDDVKAFFKREAEDVKDGLDSLRDKLDSELTKREEELAATPNERLDMIKEDIDSDGRLSGGEGRAEVGALEDEPQDGSDDQSGAPIV
jgi:hypothetical protein